MSKHLNVIPRPIARAIVAMPALVLVLGVAPAIGRAALPYHGYALLGPTGENVTLRASSELAAYISVSAHVRTDKRASGQPDFDR